MNNNDNIIQIMPAPKNLYSTYKNSKGKNIYTPIVSIALTKDDDIKFCNVDDSVYISLKVMTLKNIILKYITLQS